MLGRKQRGRDPALAASLSVVVVASATILGALLLQYGAGLAPCPLCLDQRIAYYVTIPLAVIIAVASARGAPRSALVAGLAVVAVAMLANAALGAYHAGVEWKWWPGPQDCSGPMTGLGSASDLLHRLNSLHVVRCDEAAWRLFGLSLAGYNVVISLSLAGIAIWGARPRPAR
jgi:disulfide bond formation protein DsbB